MNDAGPQNAAPSASVVGACASCGKPASHGRAFCGHCGARLWDPCIECGARNQVCERFCCQSGVDMRRRLEAIQADLDDRLATAAQNELDGNLLAAFQALEGSPEHDHSQLASRIETVRRRRTELHDARQQAIAERGQRVDQARQLIQQRKFAAAFETLDKIPASLRDQEARRLLAELEQPLSEIKRLRAALGAILKSGKADGALSMAERLVELEPDADDVRRVSEQLRLQQQQLDNVLSKKLLAKARDSVAKNDYLTARRCLERMPLLTHDTDLKLHSAIEDRVWLEHQLKIQPYADKTLLRLAERLTKLQPRDEIAAKLFAEMGARISRAENCAGRPFIPWAKSAASTRFGVMVEPICNLPKIHWQADRTEISAWVGNMRQFLVALGLALGGLGDAPLADLEFKAGASSWLGRLTAGRKRKSAAWGIDVGSSGLKALRLARQGEVITVDRASMISYDHEQPRNEATQIQPLIGPAFEKFVQQCAPGDEPLMVSFPGIQSLGRFFSLPRMKSARLEKALEIEVATQIPLPADEIVWQSHSWKTVGEAADPAFQSIAVVAAKKKHVELRTSALAEQGSQAVALQSECVSLLNVLLHCHADQIAQLSPQEAVGLVEVGDSATHLVAVCPGRGPWFRTIHRGIRTINRALVDALSVTWQQADLIRQQWPSAQPLAKLDKMLAAPIEELTRDMEHAIRAFSDSTGARMTRLYIAGGGCDQFGLVREWSRSDERTAAIVES